MTITDESAAPSRRQRRNSGKKKGRWVWITALVVAGAMLLAACVAGVYLWRLSNSFDSQAERLDSSEIFPQEENRPADVNEDSKNILLLGSDTRGELEDDIADIRGQRADTIMVANIPADRSSVQVMSIMRDNWVEIPGHGQAKINAALAYGGVPLLVETIEGLIGTRIDHVAIVDFEGFKDITDALGGVTVQNEVAFTKGEHTFNQGQIILGGEEALTYVRERYAFSDGDYQRARNQQAYIMGVVQKVLSRDTLTSPGRIADLVDAVAPYMVTDDGLSSSTAAGIGFSLRNLRSDDIRFFTSPTNGTGTAGGGQSVVLPDWDSWEQLREAFENDTVAEYEPTGQ
ncbi:LCP family protein [Sediminivirga luteola]|uniref:LCP family protein n=1 Tax=Sediminivirga luteola TaxID=1774748 RepID=UPI0016636C32|nr:LCP family protein [Sediminivirga luteola]